MKVVQSSILRAIIAIVVGVLLILYRNDTLVWLVRSIGILFFMSGLISCVVYYVESRRIKNATPVFDAEGKEIIQRKPFFPIVGLGSMILGLFLALLTDTFITYTVYLLGTILILGAINQFFNLAHARQFSYVPFIYWLFPCATLLVAVYFMFKPLNAAALPLLAVGWCFVFYGVIEAINTFQIYRMRKAFEKAAPQIEDAEIVEELTTEN